MYGEAGPLREGDQLDQQVNIVPLHNLLAEKVISRGRITERGL